MLLYFIFFIMRGAHNFFGVFDWQQMLSSFWILFAVLDILGSIPIIMSVRKRAGCIYPRRTTVVAGVIMVSFLFLGQPLLNLFSIDIASFAVAGSLVLLIIALEMILDVSIFHIEPGSAGASAIVPLAFPVVSGTGTLITLLTLKANYDMVNILCAIFPNLMFVYVVMQYSEWIEHQLGRLGVNIIHKVMGVIVLALAVKLLKTYLFS